MRCEGFTGYGFRCGSNADWLVRGRSEVATQPHTVRVCGRHLHQACNGMVALVAVLKIKENSR